MDSNVKAPPRQRSLTRPAGTPQRLEQLSNRELIAQTLETATLLVKKEVELARAELKTDLKAEVAMVKGLGVASVCALCTLNLLLVAVVVALGAVMPEWAAALIVAAAVLALGAVAGLVGWGMRVRNPLAATRRSLGENLRWAKGRIA